MPAPFESNRCVPPNCDLSLPTEAGVDNTTHEFCKYPCGSIDQSHGGQLRCSSAVSRKACPRS